MRSSKKLAVATCPKTQSVWLSAVNDAGEIFDCRKGHGAAARVAYVDNNRIEKFDSDGKYLTQWGSTGSGDGQFNFGNLTAGLAIDREDNIYVADIVNQRIVKFDANGKFLIQWGGAGDRDGQFNYPHGITVDRHDNIYVSDENFRIQKFDKNGKFLMQWGSKGKGPGQMDGPHGFVIDCNRRLYFADRYNGRMQIFDENGNLVTGGEKHLAMDLDDSQYQQLMQAGLTVNSNFDLKPGRYLVRQLVRDTASQETSARNQAIELAK